MTSLRIFGFAALAIVLGGCFASTPQLDHFAYRLERQMPGTTFEQEMGLKFGRLSLGLTRGILGAVKDEDTDQASRVLKGLKRVELSSYRVKGRTPDPHLAESLHRSMEKAGWQTIVRARDAGEMVWVLFRQSDAQINGFMVVTLEDEELFMVRLKGRLDRSLAAAMHMAYEDHDDD